MKNDLILAKDVEFTMDTRKSGLNNNVLVVGTSGCGKTRNVVTPNILQATGSYIISDPKGNLYDKYATYLFENGYEVKKLNFINPRNSIKYNFFEYIKNDMDIIKIATILGRHSEEAARTVDPFWDEAAIILLSSLIGYLHYERPRKERNIQNLFKLINACEVNENDANEKTVLDRIMDEVAERNPNSFALKQYKKFRCAAGRTLRSILITVNSKLGVLDCKEMNEMLSKDEVNIGEIGMKPTAIFVVVSDNDRSMDVLANIFFTQTMNELCLVADQECKDQRLPVPVRFILDDFATNVKIENFPRMIASIRSREISVMLLIQAESQLKKGYGDDDSTIIGNCDTYMYMGGNDVDTAKNIAERLNLPLRKILYMPVRSNWIFRRGSEPINGENIELEKYIARNYSYTKAI